jgi:hypothetical protein
MQRLVHPSHTVGRQTRAIGSTLLRTPGTSEPLPLFFGGTSLSAGFAALACTRPRSDMSALIRERTGISFKIPVVSITRFSAYDSAVS